MELTRDRVAFEKLVIHCDPSVFVFDVVVMVVVNDNNYYQNILLLLMPFFSSHVKENTVGDLMCAI